MSDLKKVGETKNFGLWKRVFSEVKEKSKGAFDLDETWGVVSDLGAGDQDGMDIKGVFEKNGKKVTIQVEWIPTQDAITKVEFS
ncbi:MAG TPA: hypothetical protein VGE62_04175 [Candidatus Paceibacterota bacterium]